jgi:hypothetical protein
VGDAGARPAPALAPFRERQPAAVTIAVVAMMAQAQRAVVVVVLMGP